MRTINAVTGCFVAGALAGALLFAPAASQAGQAPAPAPPPAPKAIVQVGLNLTPGYGINAIAWTPDGTRLATLGQEGKLLIWDPGLKSPSDRKIIFDTGMDQHLGQTHSLDVSPDGRFAVTVGLKDNSIPETQVLDLGRQKTFVVAWVRNRSPLLWLGGPVARVIMGPPAGCSGAACRPALLDPGQCETRLVAQSADPASWVCDLAPLPAPIAGGERFTASADHDEFAIVVVDANGGRRLSVRSAAGSLNEIAGFDLGPGKIAEVGFDAAGRHAFVRTEGGDLTTFDLATKAARAIRLAPVLAIAGRTVGDVTLTDPDAHVVLVEASGGVGLIDYEGRLAPVFAPTGLTVQARFAHRGAVLLDDQGNGQYLEFAARRLSSLGPGITQSAADGLSGPDGGPGLALSPDGKVLASADGWWEPLGAAIGTAPPRTPLTGFPTLSARGDDAVWLSPNGRRFALLLSDGVATTGWVFDLDAARLFKVFSAAATADPSSIKGAQGLGRWIADDQLVLSVGGRNAVSINVNTLERQTLAAPPDGMTPYDGAPYDAPDLICGPEPKGRWDEGNALRGYAKPACIVWLLNGDGSIRIDSTRTLDKRRQVWSNDSKFAADPAKRIWAHLFYIYMHRDGTWSAATTDGRYDTNESADTSDVRWLMPNRPWVSLPAQTFMRQLYQPGLMAKMLDCNLRQTCDTVFRPSPNLASLNMVLPEVNIVCAAPQPGSDRVLVYVEAQEGQDPGAPGGKTHSGVYDLRLFRDNKLVDQWPAPPPGDESDVGVWRSHHQLPSGPDRAPCSTADPHPDWAIHRTFSVRTPSGPAGTELFSAYAFNEDRVKSETAKLGYDRPATPGRRSRAFVLSIGVNDYDNPDWALRFAAQDADLMAQTLKAGLPKTTYDVRTLTLLGKGPAHQGSLALIHDALTLLGRTDGAIGETTAADQASARGRLAQAGVANPAAFETATPDDVVIVTYAGHGWTSDKGEFYLVPADGKVTPDGAPNPFTFISAGQLTDWLRPVDAGETSIVIDACHSAASVEAAGFKPAPLGDPGLGQLAFDKGIRILAASQADAVAMEDEGLGHGLLTYALTKEALGDADASDDNVKTLKATVFKDGRTLDAWLAYAARRLPSLSDAVMKARETPRRDAGDIIFDPPALARAAAAPAQEPQLFDFTAKASGVLLTAASGGHS